MICFYKIQISAPFLHPLEEICNLYHLVLASGQVPERGLFLPTYLKISFPVLDAFFLG